MSNFLARIIFNKIDFMFFYFKSPVHYFSQKVLRKSFLLNYEKIWRRFMLLLLRKMLNSNTEKNDIAMPKAMLITSSDVPVPKFCLRLIQAKLLIPD